MRGLKMDTKLLQDMLDIISASKKLNKAKREFSKVKRNSSFNFSGSIPAKYCAIIDFMRSNKMFDDTTGMEICTELAKNNQLIDDTVLEYCKEADKDIYDKAFAYSTINYMKG